MGKKSSIIQILFITAPMLIAAFCFVSLKWCNVLDKIDTIPTMEGAYRVDRCQFVNGSCQLSYAINAIYPTTVALDFYGKYFSEEGWKRCTGKMEEWQNHYDAAEGTNKKIYQISHYFIRKDRPVLSKVELRYISENADNREPDNSEQQVYVIIDTPDDLQDKLKQLSITCQ